VDLLGHAASIGSVQTADSAFEKKRVLKENCGLCLKFPQALL
jgi:hypothetical protein